MSPLDLEIKVTHAVDEIKAGKVSNSGIEMIEIDLSSQVGKIITSKELMRLVSVDAPRKWIYKINRYEYRELADALVLIYERKLTMEKSQLEKSWRKSYRKLKEKCQNFEAAIERSEYFKSIQIVKEGMSKEEAVEALGCVALNGPT